MLVTVGIYLCVGGCACDIRYALPNVCMYDCMNECMACMFECMCVYVCVCVCVGGMVCGSLREGPTVAIFVRCHQQDLWHNIDLLQLVRTACRAAAAAAAAGGWASFSPLRIWQQQQQHIGSRSCRSSSRMTSTQPTARHSPRPIPTTRAPHVLRVARMNSHVWFGWRALSFPYHGRLQTQPLHRRSTTGPSSRRHRRGFACATR